VLEDRLLAILAGWYSNGFTDVVVVVAHPETGLMHEAHCDNLSVAEAVALLEDAVERLEEIAPLAGHA
jgi:hypothetical protein